VTLQEGAEVPVPPDRIKGFVVLRALAILRAWSNIEPCKIAPFSGSRRQVAVKVKELTQALSVAL
jgi:hypothetical protein